MHRLQSVDASCSAAVVPLDVVDPAAHVEQTASAMPTLYAPVPQIAQSLFAAVPATARPYPAMHTLQSDDAS
jgi:hypothetical protein